jgi:hypothetical protein
MKGLSGHPRNNEGLRSQVRSPPRWLALARLVAGTACATAFSSSADRQCVRTVHEQINDLPIQPIRACELPWAKSS